MTCDEYFYGKGGKPIECKKPRTLHEAVSDLRYILGSFDPFTLFALGWLVGSIMTWIAAWIVVGEI